MWEALIAADQAEPQIIADVVERSAHASWLNPVLSADTYYVHAIAVKPDCRGRGIGYRLLDNAIRSARNSGFTHLQLDVLADNPAVRFYESMGLEVLAETRAPKPAAFGVPTEFRMGLLLR